MLIGCHLVFGLTSRVVSQGITDTAFYIQEVRIFAHTAVEERGLVMIPVNGEILRATMHKSLSDMIMGYTPLFIKSYGPGSLATVSFRGTSSSHTRVEWNGIMLNNPMNGQADFSLIPVFMADKVTILPGGSSLAGGSGALGGSIRLTTEPIWEKDQYGSLYFGLGSFNFSRVNMDLGGGKERVQTRIRIFRENSDNDFRFFNPYSGQESFEEQKNAGYTAKGVLHELYLRAGTEDVVSLKTWYQDADRNLPALMTYSGSEPEEYQKNSNLWIIAEWRKYREGLHMETSVSGQMSSMEYFAANQSLLGKVIHYDTRSNSRSLFIRNSIRFPVSARTVFLGRYNLDLSDANYMDEETGSGFRANRMETGYNLSLHSEILPSFSGYALMRIQFTDGRFLPVMPSMGMEFRPNNSERISIKMNLTRNYHLPSLNDLHWIPGGNPGLHPEHGMSTDLSIEYKTDPVRQFDFEYRLNAYISSIKNWILWVPGDLNYWQPVNVSEVFARGIEGFISGKWENGPWSSHFSGSYAFTRTSDVTEGFEQDNLEKQLIYVPVHKANSNILLKWNNLTLSYLASFSGRRYTTSTNEDNRHMLPAYCLQNLGLEKRFMISGSVFDTGVHINNLFNTSYQAVLYRAMPGRSFLFQIKYGF